MLIFLACSKAKSDAEGVEQKTEEQAEITKDIPLLTNERIDEFVKMYPVVFEKMTARKDALLKYRHDNPVESAEGAKAVEELKAELAALGVDMDQFNFIYQKILYSTYYLNQKQRAEGISTEQIDIKIAELRSKATQPDTDEELKVQLKQAISELEAAKVLKTQLPAGLTEAEVKLVEARFAEIQNVIMKQIDKVRDEDAKTEASTKQQVTTNTK